MSAEPRPGSGTPDADDGHTVNVGPVTVADPGSGTPDPTPNGQTWVCRADFQVYGSCNSPVGSLPGHNGCGPVPPAPSSDTPSDERHPGYPHQPGEPLTLDLTVDLARPAPSPVPEASGRGEVVQPTMHILRRADGEEMGEFAFWATDGPDGWDMAEDTDHDEDTVYEILACYPVARRKILWSTLCETCDGEGDGCPACAGSGECEPPDAEHMPIIARPAPSSSPVGDRGLDDLRVELAVTQAALHQACHDGWSDAHGAMAGYLRDARAAAADRGEPTDA